VFHGFELESDFRVQLIAECPQQVTGALQNCLPELAAHSRPAASALVVALVVKLTAAAS
jgi:hypothetical protein